MWGFRGRSCFLAIFIVTAIPPPLAAQDSGPVPVRIVLNSSDKGDHIVVLTETGDILVQRKALAAMNLQALPEKTVDFEGEPHVSLEGMKPDLEFKLDLNTLTLHITTDARKLGRHVVDYAETGKRPLKVTRQNSAYLNYNVTYSLDTNDRFSSLSVPWEVAIRLGDTLLHSTFNYQARPSSEGRVETSKRLISSLIWDFREDRMRLVAGDFFTGTGQLGGGGQYGGLHLSRRFSLTPGFVSSPLVGFSGLAETPSVVEVYRNNILMKKENVPAGPFELLNLPNTQGRGELKIVVTDAFGRKKEFIVPYFVSPGLLKPGLQEFSYSLGAIREKIGQENFDYGDPAFLASHRMGLTTNMTGGFRLELARTGFFDPTGQAGLIEVDVANFGLEADLVLGPVGQVRMGVAKSRETPVKEDQGEPRDGSAGFLNYSFILGIFGLSY
ncbi:MAG: fimbrial biogenesis outer membrane usher protein, partial [Nitrospinae bacterium]|nr:fimbrial biogenesis outer membrane usher protein [Nitrospinota bacterium]